ncbi:hypothetical protein MKEN_00456100 [Mycena kentingensis (nom. inval.)]|nr:hypothetical protein MKEN_00456100 [Mycena kentingensis (nom. inval.)]
MAYLPTLVSNLNDAMAQHTASVEDLCHSLEKELQSQVEGQLRLRALVEAREQQQHERIQELESSLRATVEEFAAAKAESLARENSLQAEIAQAKHEIAQTKDALSLAVGKIARLDGQLERAEAELAEKNGFEKDLQALLARRGSVVPTNRDETPGDDRVFQRSIQESEDVPQEDGRPNKRPRIGNRSAASALSDSEDDAPTPATGVSFRHGDRAGSESSQLTTSISAPSSVQRSSVSSKKRPAQAGPCVLERHALMRRQPRDPFGTKLPLSLQRETDFQLPESVRKKGCQGRETPLPGDPDSESMLIDELEEDGSLTPI